MTLEKIKAMLGRVRCADCIHRIPGSDVDPYAPPACGRTYLPVCDQGTCLWARKASGRGKGIDDDKSLNPEIERLLKMAIISYRNGQTRYVELTDSTGIREVVIAVVASCFQKSGGGER